ncbi:MAG: hypothetical protein KDJ52_14960 [Anaerolineae bacterium]|nr:hypothetical protein [Anaerolineae bacterium]
MTTTYQNRGGVLGVGLLLLIALGIFMLFDVEIALSINAYITLAYTAFWLLIGFLLLRRRPNRYKLTLLTVFLCAILIVYFIDWNGRKHFMRAFQRIEVGMTVAQADETMNSYTKFVGPTSQFDAQGQVMTGKISYRSSRQSWNDADVAILTIEDGRVVEFSYHPD